MNDEARELHLALLLHKANERIEQLELERINYLDALDAAQLNSYTLRCAIRKHLQLHSEYLYESCSTTDLEEAL